MQIISPLASGNGAHVVHKMLEARIPGYRVCSYHPWLTLLPPLVYPVCRRTPADLVHTTPDYAIFNMRARSPLVITFHNFVLDHYMRAYSSWLQRLHYATDLKLFTRKAVQRATRLTAVSRFTAELARRELGIEEPIRVIYNGIDERHFSPAKVNENGKIRVFFSGNLSRRKGADLLPAIAERLDDNIEILYTSGLRGHGTLPAHPALVPVGSIPYKEMPQVYQRSDMLLFPSRREGFGLAAAEAMACGLPVVASNCSSLPELIEDGRGGYLCTPGNPAAFAERINNLAASPGLRSEMGSYNRNRVEEDFTLARMVEEYMTLFQESLG